MSVVSRLGFGVCVRWAAGLAVLGSLVLSACSSSSDGSSPPLAQAGDAGDGGSAVGAEGGAPPSAPAGGDGGAVSPGDLACQTSADCKGDKHVCDPVLGCVACAYDWDCPANDRCDANQCFKKQACSASTECASDAAHPVCDPIQNVCVGCRLDTDCAAGQRCGAGKCESIKACANSHACASGEVCDRVAGVCVACVVDGDCGAGTACVANACVPTCKSDKECLGIGLLCDAALGRCVECVSNADCPAAYFCGANQVCAADVCQQGDEHCEDAHTLATCSLAGDTFVDSTCDSTTSCQEQSMVAAACEPQVCAPGSVLCAADGQSVVTCSADGLSVTSTVPCGAGQACIANSCQDVVCPASTFVCDGADLYQCNDTGTAKIKLKTCSNNATCNTQTGTCTPPTCTAGAPLCDGNTATVCASDGKGPLAGGTPCGDGKACYLGSCLPLVCTGAYQCADNVLHKCAANGTSFSSTVCNSIGLCDPVGGKCLTPVCTPGAFACNGQVATRCKADGSGYETGGTDCAAQSLVCDGGGCLPKACTPNASFCSGGNPQLCGATGTTYVPTDSCSSAYYCQPGSYYCQFDKCTAGSAQCNGNLATTCAADGSGPVDGGTDCSLTGKACVSGACQPVVCTKGALTCQGEAVYQCNPAGTGTALYQTCTTAQFCDNSSGSAVCGTDLCLANSLGCDQEVVSTCSANGGSWTNPGVNCAASNQLCAFGGTCAAQEVATQGTGSLSSSTFFDATQFASFRVTTPRKLTRLEIEASVSGVQKFSWVVYQKRATSTVYDIVYQVVTTQATPTLDFVSSPALSYTFAAGKTYAIGVHITGSSTVGVHFAGVAQAGFVATPFAAYYSDDTQPSATVSLSPLGYVPYLRFTTTLP